MTEETIRDLAAEHEITKEKTKKIVDDFLRAHKRLKSEDPSLLCEVLLGSLGQIAEQFTTQEYSFNLAIDLFVEQTSSRIEKLLQVILDERIPEEYSHDFTSPDMDALFCAYYALSLIYKKKNNYDNLRALLDNFGEEDKRYSRFDVLSAYPLYYEVRSRCYKRLDNLDTALKQDKIALNLLNAYGIENHATSNSYASTVSMILATGRKVSKDKFKNACDYIEKSISYNPEYPKYYFVKAQLIFYSAMLEEDIDDYRFERICEQATSLVEQSARIKLHQLYNGKSEHRRHETQKYNAFLNKIEQAVEQRSQNSDKKIEDIKEEILNSTDYYDCPRPEMPDLDENTPYFYICYSTRDYKSVFCDMVELYHQRIPFKYDRRLTAGQEWNPQVEASIRSEQCKGVVFYISENTLVSKSFCEEIAMVCETNMKPYFAVNLEGEESSSKIMIDTILEVCKKGKPYPISATQMRSFINAFHDRIIHVSKLRRNGDNGIKHFRNYLEQLKLQFKMDV